MQKPLKKIENLLNLVKTYQKQLDSAKFPKNPHKLFENCHSAPDKEARMQSGREECWIAAQKAPNVLR